MHNQPEDKSQADKIDPHGSVHYRRVDTGHGLVWLSQAWRLFKQNPGVWISSVALLLLLLMTSMLIPVIQLLGVVVTPVLMGGLMLGAFKQIQGQKPQLKYLFSGFEHQLSSLLMLGCIYLGASFFASLLAVEIAELLGFTIMPVTPEMLAAGNIDLGSLMESLMVPMLLLLTLMIPVFMAYWFAPALVVLQKISPWQALKRSFQACLTNTLAFTLYGLAGFFGLLLVVFGLVIIASVAPALSLLINILVNFVLMSLVLISILTAFMDIFNPDDLAEEFRLPPPDDNKQGDMDQADKDSDTLIV